MGPAAVLREGLLSFRFPGVILFNEHLKSFSRTGYSHRPGETSEQPLSWDGLVGTFMRLLASPTLHLRSLAPGSDRCCDLHFSSCSPRDRGGRPPGKAVPPVHSGKPTRSLSRTSSWAGQKPEKHWSR